MHNNSTGYDHYIRYLTEIRSLSSPSLDGISNAEGYSSKLRENFTRIGMLASHNRAFLDETLFPLLRSESELSEADADDMDEFTERLLNAEVLENLDPVITSMVSERLLRDSFEKGESLAQIREMDIWMSTLYTLMNITGRITEYPDISMEYRCKGFELGDIFLSMREHERFAAIPDEQSRELVLTNCRYLSAFYENLFNNPEENRSNLAHLEESLAICEDPFYPPLMPDYDWDYARFRTLGYYAIATDCYNARGFTTEQLSLICDKTEELWRLWHEDPERYGEFDDERYLLFLLTRNRFLAERISEDQYLGDLLVLYKQRQKEYYSLEGIVYNVLIPTEIMCVLEHRQLTEADKALLIDLYNNVVNYAFLMPNSGILSYMLEYLSQFLQHFIEVPEGIQFEDIMLDLLAAMHPPTYVHSRMVAQFTACLCGHLIDTEPELFVGTCGLSSVDEVEDEREKLIRFAYHAALCHDAGKLFIIDTVFVYGRRLEDMEFNLIKTHPKMGASILRRYASTVDYAEVALGHHRWYDNSRGYPEEFDTSASRIKTIIDLVACADCLDAATDTIGRSYSRGKTIEEFIDELEEGKGTRYAPWLVDLVSREEVKADLIFLLGECRERNYRNTYHLLKNVHDQTVAAMEG